MRVSKVDGDDELNGLLERAVKALRNEPTLTTKNGVTLFKHPLHEITQEAFAKLGVDKTIQTLLPLVYGAGEWKNGGVAPVEGCNSDMAIYEQRTESCAMDDLECVARSTTVRANLDKERIGYSHYVGLALSENLLSNGGDPATELRRLYNDAQNMPSGNPVSRMYPDLSHGTAWYTMSRVNFGELNSQGVLAFKQRFCFREMWFYNNECCHGIGHGIFFSYLSTNLLADEQSPELGISSDQQPYQVALNGDEYDKIIGKCTAFTMFDASECSRGVYHSAFTLAPTSTFRTVWGMPWCAERVWPVHCFTWVNAFATPWPQIGAPAALKSSETPFRYTNPALCFILGLGNCMGGKAREYELAQCDKLDTEPGDGMNDAISSICRQAVLWQFMDAFRGCGPVKCPFSVAAV
jgi:hypothetical protein